ncbi:MAG: iron-sulfur cluster assembly scaffold protein, partial [Patescibacteria group bacterium]
MTAYRPHPWTLYSKKLAQKIENPQFVGCFKPEDRGLRLVIGRQDDIALYWLVDETDGVIADIRYQVIGPSALIGALEAA